MKTYKRETKVTYTVIDEVQAGSYDEAEAKPITELLPEGATVEKPVAILLEG